MQGKPCFYNERIFSHGWFRKGKLLNGKCYAFVTHSFDTDNVPEAAAVIEDDQSGELVIVPAGYVRFTTPGNEDKR